MATNEFKPYRKMYSTVDKIEFSDWLLNEMRDRKWSQADLARASGLSRGAVGNVLRQERDAGKNFCISVAHAFGYPPEKVFRMAGLLPPEPINDVDEETKYLMSQLSERDKEEIKALMRVKVELNKNSPPTEQPKHINETRPGKKKKDPALSV